MLQYTVEQIQSYCHEWNKRVRIISGRRFNFRHKVEQTWKQHQQQSQRYRNKAKRYFDNRGIFSVEAKRTGLLQNFERSKQSEHIYVHSLQVNTNWVCPKLSRIEQKRAGLVQNFPGSNKNELGQSKTFQDRTNTNWVSPKLSRIEQKRTGFVQNFSGSNKNESSQSKTQQDRSKTSL